MFLANTAALPLDDAAFARMLEPLDSGQPHIALAASGGGDSMAALALLAAWGGVRGRRITALTVDHGMRADAWAEAAHVARAARRLGIGHVVLRLPHLAQRGGEREGGLSQAAARAGRWRALAAWARRAPDAPPLVLAHTQDDNAETFWMRLGRASGVDGLAAMARRRRMYGVEAWRPLLGVSRAALRATARDRGVSWCEDPSNQDTRFMRVRVRARAQALAACGLDAGAVAAVAARMARARASLVAHAEAAFARLVRPQPWGGVRIDARGWLAAPEEDALRVLGMAFVAVGGGVVRLARLEAMAADIASALALGGWRVRGLAGVLVMLEDGAIVAMREGAAAARAPALALSKAALSKAGGVWDGRFVIGWHGEAPPAPALRAQALGEAGLAQARASGALGALAEVPPLARAASPALWCGERLIGSLLTPIGSARADFRLGRGSAAGSNALF